MSIPDFERAEYVEPRIVEGQVVEGHVAGQPLARTSVTAFPLALVYGAVAAIVGAIGYGMVSSFGFMISIVAIGIAWLIAKAMMTASGGVGNRSYQVAAALLTYFAVSCGELVPALWRAHLFGSHLPGVLLNPIVLKYLLLGPFLELQSGINGILGLIILFIGLRAAWRLAAGSPGFGGSGAAGRRRSVDPLGLR